MLRAVILFSLCTFVLAPFARAENEGLADLDRAMDLKLRAERQRDVTEVIQFCRSAMEKGLDKANTRYAKSLLASSLLQRAAFAGDAVLSGGGTDSLWRNYRTLALKDLEEAVKLAPNLPDALLLIARLNLLPKGNKERAVAALDSALALDGVEPKVRASLLLLRADVEQNHKKSLKLLHEAIKLSPGNVEPIRARGIVYAEMGKPKLAVADFAEVLKVNPDDVETLADEARVLAELKQYDRALISADKARQLAPHSVVPLTLRAQIHVGQDNLKAAMYDLNQALSMQPDNPVVLWLRASLYHEMHKPEAALADLDRALKRKPDFEEARRLRWAVLIDQEKFDQVIAEMEEQLKRTPGDPVVLLLRAGLYHQMHKPEAALADLDRALRRKPDFDKARHLRWAVLVGQRKFDQVIAEMEDQLKRTPDDQDTLIQMAMFCTVQHQPKKAITIYSSILAKDPDNVAALDGRANALLGIGKHAEAIADYNKAMKLQSDDSGTLNNLAWVLATSPEDNLRDGRRAVELATKACKLTHYERAHILSTLAAAYAETGDFRSAVKWSKKAVELGNKDGQPDTQQSLEKELRSYRQGKPWRELLSEGLEPGPEKKAGSP